jgi:Glycosyl transferase family 2
MPKKTLISHFYNEEYLLPWWLDQHLGMFDDGILIDYHSTDGSVEIIKTLAPKWRIVRSRNKEFSAGAADAEAMEYEASVPEWKIVLTSTEFLVGDIDSLIRDDMNEHDGFRVTARTMVDRAQHSSPTYDRPLVEQKPWGIAEAAWQRRLDRLDKEIAFRRRFHLAANFRRPSDALLWAYSPAIRGRLLHRRTTGQYEVGRHLWGISPSPDAIGLTNFWFGLSPWSLAFRERKLQVKTKISESDRINGLGYQHFSAMEHFDELHDFWAGSARKMRRS